jgi:predicted dehydrogenase
MDTSLSRRRLMLAAAAAPLAPLFVPARAFGANDRIRLGFVGVGKMGLGHLKSFLEEAGVEVRAICDVEESRRELAKKLVLDGRPGAAVATHVDHTEMLARDEVDAVVISTPDHWHTTQLVHAAQAKKDIYCEKPLTLTIDESELAVRAVRASGIVLQTGSQQRSGATSGFRRACEAVRSGRLGRLLEISVHFGPTSGPCDLPAEPLAAGLDWDRWQGQAPARPYHALLCRRGEPSKYPFLPGWRDYREYSGGQVTDWGCHHLDIVQWALGKDGSGPDVVEPPAGEARLGGARLRYRRTPVGDDVLVTHRTYGNGIRFIGTEGEIWVNRKELLSTPEAILKDPPGEKDVRLEVSENHRRGWLEAIRTRKDPICKIEIGAATAAVCHLVNLAYWKKRTLRWNAATWSLTGAPAAWKGRPQRAGYELPKVSSRGRA